MLLAEFAVDRQINEKAPRGAWHRTHGWLHPVKTMEAAKDAVEASELTREEVADALGVDLAEVDAENTRDQKRDQISPGMWTTLPEGFDFADDETSPFAATERDDVTCDFDPELGDSRARGMAALLFQDFSGASDADVENALALVREGPSLITALKANLDAIVEMGDAA
jgi:hypothetical protein